MTNYTQYEVVRKESLEELEQAVEKAIRGGWQPIGGVCTGKTGETRANYSRTFYAQAMVA